MMSSVLTWVPRNSADNIPPIGAVRQRNIGAVAPVKEPSIASEAVIHDRHREVKVFERREQNEIDERAYAIMKQESSVIRVRSGL
jgi:hypothetical protein